VVFARLLSSIRPHPQLRDVTWFLQRIEQQMIFFYYHETSSEVR
jgi:hypothetical protein